METCQLSAKAPQKILNLQAEYIRLNCFYGGMIWVLDSDCFRDDCPKGAYPLLTALKEVLTGDKSYTDIKNIT